MSAHRKVAAGVAVGSMLGGLLVMAISEPKPAHGLANPLTTGANQVVTVPGTGVFQQVSAVGLNCAVTFVNMSATPVYTGFAGVTTSTGIPVCNDTTVCVGSWYVRDAVPAAIWYGIAAGGDLPGVRIEKSSGCKSP